MPDKFRRRIGDKDTMLNNRVSVLVTFYNQEKYVDKAMESILSQKTDFGVKIIVGDDGSTDGTVEAVNRWIEKYPDMIEIYVMDRNNGVRIPGFRASGNRINILKHVDTDYFIFLDGDDYFCSDLKLQKQVDILDSSENTDCVACGHNTHRLYKSGKKEPATDPSLKEGKISAKKYWKEYYIHTDSLLFRSSIIPKIDFDLLENSFNDNIITYAAIQFGSIYYLPEYWAVYVQTDDGIWTSGNTLINLIRNMIFYDISCKINKNMKAQSICRFSYVWKELYDMRKSIDSSKLAAYLEEAKSKGCKNALRWITYNELNPFQKFVMAFRLFTFKTATRIYRHTS